MGMLKVKGLKLLMMNSRSSRRITTTAEGIHLRATGAEQRVSAESIDGKGIQIAIAVNVSDLLLLLTEKRVHEGRGGRRADITAGGRHVRLGATIGRCDANVGRVQTHYF